MVFDPEIKTFNNYFFDKTGITSISFGSSLRVGISIKSYLNFLVEPDYSKHIGLFFVEIKLDLINKLPKKNDLILSNIFKNIVFLSLRIIEV